MKKNNKLEKMARWFMVLAMPVLMVSCGTYVYYDDGIYGERPQERIRYVEVSDNRPVQRTAPAMSKRKHAEYFGEKARQYDNRNESFSHFTDIDAYNSGSYDGGEPYAGWGSNASQVTVNIYDNNWGYPYYGYDRYWNYRYPYNYYPRYRSGFYWGLSLGWGNYYDPYWNWNGGYYYPYYGYRYYDYYPRYYYPRYYYGGDYYSRYDRNRYTPAIGRRGDNSRYHSGYDNNRRSENYYGRPPYSDNQRGRNDSYRYNQGRNETSSGSNQRREYNNRRDNDTYRYNQGRNETSPSSTQRREYNPNQSYNSERNNSSPSYNSGRSYESRGNSSSGRSYDSGNSGRSGNDRGTSVGRRGG